LLANVIDMPAILACNRVHLLLLAACLQTDTPLAEKITSSKVALKAATAMHPLKRIGSPEDPAAMAEFLLNPENANITGEMICVDGGLGNVTAQ
jgi:3-oxoacyl-[acyl-carrier protein] reductase